MELKGGVSNEGKPFLPPLPSLPEDYKTLGIFESNSSPGKYHYVIHRPNGIIYCTCIGFNSPNKCWHYRGMVEVLKENPQLLDKLTSPLFFPNSKKT